MVGAFKHRRIIKDELANMLWPGHPSQQGLWSNIKTPFSDITDLLPTLVLWRRSGQHSKGEQAYLIAGETSKQW
tara:strand:+ start:1001 stop:1222 length:222 start_codon:yes stop_codon:yes gene_type:complete